VTADSECLFHVEPSLQAMLHRLKDGRFQIVRDGPLPDLMTGHRYILASDGLLATLLEFGAEVTATPAILYHPVSRVESGGYQELHVARGVEPLTAAAMASQGGSLWVYNERHLFVSAALRRRLAERFRELTFSEGFSEFAADLLAADPGLARAREAEPQPRFLENAEVSAHFRSVAERLDDAMPTLLARLGSDCSVIDRSSRSGFDSSGFPSFVWEHWFQRDQTIDGQIWRAEARAHYRQPLHHGDPEELEVEWMAQIFSGGSSSRFTERATSRWPVDDVRGARLAELVEAALDLASAALDRRRREERPER
jgi:hypothetical protein